MTDDFIKKSFVLNHFVFFFFICGVALLLYCPAFESLWCRWKVKLVCLPFQIVLMLSALWLCLLSDIHEIHSMNYVESGDKDQFYIPRLDNEK